MSGGEIFAALCVVALLASAVTMAAISIRDRNRKLRRATERGEEQTPWG